MGPAILARADVAPFAAKIHGSALEYTVKPHPRVPALRLRGHGGGLRRPRRLPPHRRVALGGPARRLPDLREKTRLGPPGVDTGEFRPARGPRAGRDPLVAFVGKLIVSKGVDLLIAAWPLVTAEHPGLRLADRRLRGVRGRIATAAGGARARRPRRRPRGGAARLGRSRAGRSGRCRSSPPSSPSRRPAMWTPRERCAGSVEFVGRLEHDEVAGAAAARPRRW